MKKATIIFSFLLMSVFSVGSYFLHQIYLKGYKKEFKSYIKQNKQSTSFSTISINPSELYTNSANIIWADENKEVVYKGILYDVVSVKGKGLTVELIVVSDYKEMELKKQFASMYDVSSKSTTKNPFELLKSFFALKFIVSNIDLEFNSLTKNLSASFHTQLFQITAPIIYLESPPPDFTA